ncbi:MAG TPA: glycosyltransferase family 2 protein, partial [Vicinamibacteria bacterium]
MPKISVVAPVYNEEAVLPLFYERLRDALERLPCEAEILFVDDGSTDGTGALLEGLASSDQRVRALRFTRNFGHQAALCAGLEHCNGDAVVLIDADLQDPPELIADFYGKWADEGFDVVFGRRRRL